MHGWQIDREAETGIGAGDGGHGNAAWQRAQAALARIDAEQRRN